MEKKETPIFYLPSSYDLDTGIQALKYILNNKLEFNLDTLDKVYRNLSKNNSSVVAHTTKNYNAVDNTTNEKVSSVKSETEKTDVSKYIDNKNPEKTINMTKEFKWYIPVGGFTKHDIKINYDAEKNIISVIGKMPESMNDIFEPRFRCFNYSKELDFEIKSPDDIKTHIDSSNVLLICINTTVSQKSFTIGIK